MFHEKKIYQQRQRRRWRVRRKLKGTSERPRLSVDRTNKHISAQLIDDEKGHTLVSASTRTKQTGSSLAHGGNREAATAIGKLIAERAKEIGVEQVCFDRGPFRYHGRVAALADAAREGGLSF